MRFEPVDLIKVAFALSPIDGRNELASGVLDWLLRRSSRNGAPKKQQRVDPVGIGKREIDRDPSAL